MAQQSIPDNPKYRYTYYTDLKGIDLTSDVTQIAVNRAADLNNIMPDPDNSNPRKRVGWRKLYTFATGTQFLGSRHLVEWGVDIIVTNKAIFCHDSSDSTWASVTTLASNTNSVEAGVAFIGFDSDRNYLLNAYMKRYKLIKNGSTITATALTDGYVPTTVISRNPDGTDGYAYEAVNVLSKKRIISFLASGSDTSFYFYSPADRADHYVVSIDKVEARNTTTGEWETITVTAITGSTITAYSDATKTATNTYTLKTGFTTTGRAPAVAGQDNFRATITEFSGESEQVGGSTVYYGYYDPVMESLLKNGVCARYGMRSMDREFYATGNGRIYYTDPDNYDFLPDNNYLSVEVDTPIAGFHRKNNYLVAVTQDSAEFTIYMIAGSTYTITHHVFNTTGVTESVTEDMTYFVARTAMAGTGAIAKRSFATLVDDALFLSRRGIFAITSNTVTSETVLANRSELINPRLIEERNLENAVAAIWNGMYLLALNTHVYLLDSKNTHRNLDVSYGYECYYWTNVPVQDMLSYQGNLFFGDTSGHWCRFNTDITNVTAYEDDGTLGENGNLTGGDPVYAMYSTRLDCDGAPQYLKTLNKRGTALQLMQLSNSEIKLSVSKDGNTPILINKVNLDNRFTWTLVDFENFTFNTISNIRTFYPKKKIKKYKYLQFIFESDEADMNFGICGLTKTYYLGNFAKR